MRKTLASMFIVCCLPTALFMQAQTNQSTLKKETMEITESWDKVFPKSDKVNHSKITFVNRYGITLVADLYQPINASGRMPAIAVSGPFGAVKEQCSGLYAQKMAERGYLTIAFDPSFIGESGGTPRAAETIRARLTSVFTFAARSAKYPSFSARSCPCSAESRVPMHP